ncbi:MAG: sulfatase [bacterium]|nr:sulfatase [bacterium]
MKVVVFDISALRADHLGCYGYARPISPAIDQLARSGARWEHAFTTDVTNAGTRAAFLSGRCGAETGVVTDGQITDTILGHTPISTFGRAAPRPLLQELLTAQGITTAAISPVGRLPARWFYHGWCEVHDRWAERAPAEVSARDVTAVALAWLAAHAQDDFFLYLTYCDLCARFDAPLSAEAATYWHALAACGEPEHPSEAAFAAHYQLHAAFAPRTHQAPTRTAIWKLVHDYNARLRALDDAVAAVLQQLETLGIAEHTAVLLFSDHGLLFGEAGCYGGHISTHYHCARIPLILRVPGVVPPDTVVRTPCAITDIFPTLCWLLGIEPPVGVEGVSLFTQLEQTAQEPRVIVCSHGQFTAQRAVIIDGWKLNRTWHAGFWEFADTELYHIASDPSESTNCAATEPERVMRLQRALREWQAQHVASQADPLARVACDEPPGFLQYGHELRSRVRRGELSPPPAYRGRWV